MTNALIKVFVVFFRSDYLKDNKKVDAPSATLTTEEFGTSFDRKKVIDKITMVCLIY